MYKEFWGGALLYAWPRIDSFYASRLEPIMNTSSLKGLSFCGWSNLNFHPFVCENGACTACRFNDHSKIPSDSVVCKQALLQEPTDPEKVKVSWDRIRELRRDVVAQDVTNNPGTPSASELVAWMTSKFNDKEAGAKDGEDCYVTLSTTWSSAYLRMMFFEPGKRTVEQVQEELLKHPEFYWAHLRWLTGVDPSSRVICAEGLVCGKGGMCVNCTLVESLAYRGSTRWESTHLEQICEPKEMLKVDSPPFNSIPKTSYSSSRDAFRKWYSAVVSILKNVVVTRSSDLDQDQEFCSASVEQTISWTHLTELFQTKNYENIMDLGWTRVSGYEKHLNEVLKEGVAESVVFCSWNMSSEEKLLLCVDGRCVKCSKVPQNESRFDDYTKKCSGSLEGPMDKKYRDDFREIELERVILNIERLSNFPAEVVSSEDASRWKRNFEKTATLGRLEDCDAPVELTLSQKFLLRIWPTGLDAERDHKRELMWLVGEDEKRGRKMCGDGLVCGLEGICVPCGITTGRVWELKRVCEEFGEKEFFVEIPPKSTRPAIGISTTMAGGTGADDSEVGENKGCMVGVSSKGLMFMVVLVFASQL